MKWSSEQLNVISFTSLLSLQKSSFYKVILPVIGSWKSISLKDAGNLAIIAIGSHSTIIIGFKIFSIKVQFLYTIAALRLILFCFQTLRSREVLKHAHLSLKRLEIISRMERFFEFNRGCSLLRQACFVTPAQGKKNINWLSLHPFQTGTFLRC